MSTEVDKGGIMDMGVSTPYTWVQDLPGGRGESNIQGLLLVRHSGITPSCPWGTNWCDIHSFLFSGQKIFSPKFCIIFIASGYFPYQKYTCKSTKFHYLGIMNR